MLLQAHEIHIWPIKLAEYFHQADAHWALLSEEEVMRAKRFHFPEHQMRFVTARGLLRRILSHYLGLSPQAIPLVYSIYKKPLLSSPYYPHWQFNLAHSHEMAVYALTLDHAIGVDIEKIQAHQHERVAKRYFSQQENHQLSQLSEQEKNNAFYRLWARKEAVIKAIGKGLSLPLSSFSVSASAIAETIFLENKNWYLQSLPLDPAYQAALASSEEVQSIIYCTFP